MSKFTKDDLIKGLSALNICQGDVVLVRAACRAIGDIDGKSASELINALLDVVGPNGTILGLAFTEIFLFPKKHKDYIYKKNTKVITGGLATAMLNWPGAFRSMHPTNSFVAIGNHSEDLLNAHNHNSSCFYPMNKMLELDGKMILIGCAKSSPGFSTVHLAQEKLGLATRTILKGRYGVYFEDQGKLSLFKRKDVPGCSMGFSNFYTDYIREGKLRISYVGNAYSICIRARDAFEIEYNILKKNPKYALCQTPDCFSCRGTRLYNKLDMVKYYTSYLPLLVIRRLLGK